MVGLTSHLTISNSSVYYKYVMIIKLYENYWIHSQADTELFNGEGFCIQGFIGGAHGLKREDMYAKSWLTECWSRLPEGLEWLMEPVQIGKSKFSNHQMFLAAVNDEPTKTGDKIKTFKMVFKELGIGFEII